MNVSHATTKLSDNITVSHITLKPRNAIADYEKALDRVNDALKSLNGTKDAYDCAFAEYEIAFNEYEIAYKTYRKLPTTREN